MNAFLVLLNVQGHRLSLPINCKVVIFADNSAEACEAAGRLYPTASVLGAELAPWLEERE